MVVRSGFFNSSDGDRRYEASFFAEYFASFIGNGVFPNPSTNLNVVAYNGLAVAVSAGRGWINGYYVSNTDQFILTLDVPDGTFNRIDRVIMGLNHLTREISFYSKKGNASSNPTAPLLTRDSEIYELALADIFVRANNLEISQLDITDNRLNSDECGIVTGTVQQIDTTQLFTQYNGAFNDFKNNLDVYVQEIETTTVDLINTLVNQNQQTFDTFFANLEDVLDENVAASLEKRTSNLENSQADYEYKTPTINGAQIIINKESNTNRIVFRLDSDVSGDITISSNNGETFKPLKNIDNTQVDILRKGFHEVVESTDFFTLVNRGGALTTIQMQALIDIVNDLTDNDNDLRQAFINAVIAADPNIPLQNDSTWNQILNQLPNINADKKEHYFLEGTGFFENSVIYTMLNNSTVAFYYMSINVPFKPSHYVIYYTDMSTNKSGLVVYNADTIQRFLGLTDSLATDISFRNFKAQSDGTHFYDNGTLRIPIDAAPGSCTFTLFAYA